MAVILKTTVPAKLPTVAGDLGSVAAGCTAAMTVDYYKLGRQAADMGADILEGKRKPAEMKIETQDVKQPTINVRAAKAIGLAVPEDLLAAHYDECVRIPIRAEARSLNLGNSAAIGVFEALRQQGFPHLKAQGKMIDW